MPLTGALINNITFQWFTIVFFFSKYTKNINISLYNCDNLHILCLWTVCTSVCLCVICILLFQLCFALFGTGINLFCNTVKEEIFHLVSYSLWILVSDAFEHVEHVEVAFLTVFSNRNSSYYNDECWWSGRWFVGQVCASTFCFRSITLQPLEII